LKVALNTIKQTKNKQRKSSASFVVESASRYIDPHLQLTLTRSQSDFAQTP
jgi:hypothetical protein